MFVDLSRVRFMYLLAWWLVLRKLAFPFFVLTCLPCLGSADLGKYPKRHETGSCCASHIFVVLYVFGCLLSRGIYRLASLHFACERMVNVTSCCLNELFFVRVALAPGGGNLASAPPGEKVGHHALGTPNYPSLYVRCFCVRECL